MNLEYIKTVKCPVCGCTEIVKESIDITSYGGKREIRQHVTNGRWEHRQFLCGMEIAYCPNFNTEEIYRECAHDPEIIRANEKLRANKEALLKFCNENDISDSLKRQIEYICK